MTGRSSTGSPSPSERRVPFPSDHLDLMLVPTEPGRLLDEGACVGLFDAWQEAGWLASGASPDRRLAGPLADELLPGGFLALWLDRPPGEVLYANQQGGFRVQCPSCGGNLVPAFQAAVVARRQGVDRRVSCGCGFDAALTEVPLAPPGAFARWALVFGDAGGLELTSRALQEAEERLGPLRLLARRRA